MYDYDNGVYLPGFPSVEENKRPEIHGKVLEVAHALARLKILANEISRDPLYGLTQRLKEKERNDFDRRIK
jgi:hypothetical protein